MGPFMGPQPCLMHYFWAFGETGTLSAMLYKAQFPTKLTDRNLCAFADMFAFILECEMKSKLELSE